MNVRCPKCCSDNPEDVLFCGRCGSRILARENGTATLTETLDTPFPALSPGMLFAGRFQIIEELGHGGMGRVFRAFERRIRRKSASLALMTAMALSTMAGIRPAEPNRRPQVQTQENAYLFPYFHVEDGRWYGIAVSNYLDEPTTLTFTARDKDGQLLAVPSNPVTYSLGPREQLAKLGKQIFAIPEHADVTGWVELTTTNPVGTFFQFGDNGLTQGDGGSAVSNPLSRLFFTRAYEGDKAFYDEFAAVTGISLANPNAGDVDVDMRLISRYGAATARVRIPAKGFIDSTVTELFNSDIRNGTITAQVVGSAGLGIAGFEHIQFKESVVGLNASAGNPGQKLYSAQLAHNDDYFTNLNLWNTNAFDVKATISTIKEDGTAIVRPKTYTIYGESRIESCIGTLLGLPRSVGSFSVDTQPGVIGDVIFGSKGSVYFAAALSLQTEPFWKAVFSQVANGTPWWTGLALYNPSGQDANLRIEAFDNTGRQTGAADMVLGVDSRISRLLYELIPTTQGQMGGYFTVTSDTPLIGQEIFGNNGLDMLSAVPPSVLTPSTTDR